MFPEPADTLLNIKQLLSATHINVLPSYSTAGPLPPLNDM